MEEFDCLNLNITVPQHTLDGVGNAKLPVLMFIHGGAFIGGSQSLQVCGREVYDGYDPVKRSICDNQPIIIVTLNYRVGPLGFLASAELDAFNKTNNEAFGNYGLHDQRRAIEWVSKFIADFGGNPGNITISGSSAGGSSCHYQCLFSEHKFCRAIIASGSMFASSAQPVEYHQSIFDRYVKRVRTSNKKDSMTGVDDLLSLPTEDMIASIGLGSFRPLVDHDLIPGSDATTINAAVKLPREVMIGSAAFESDLYEFVFGEAYKQDGDAGILAQSSDLFRTNSMLAHPEDFPSSPATVPEAYNLSSSALEHPGESFTTWTELAADLTFRVPPFYIAQTAKSAATSVLVYDIQATNPFPRFPRAYGKANHAINDLFFFNVAQDLIDEKHRVEWTGAAQQMQKTWTEFCHGGRPWTPMKPITDATKLGEGPVGPLFVYMNAGQGKEYGLLEDAVGIELAGRWRAILKAGHSK